MAEQRSKPSPSSISINRMTDQFPGPPDQSPLEAKAVEYLKHKVGAVFFPKRSLSVPQIPPDNISSYFDDLNKARHCVKGLYFFLKKQPVGDRFCSPRINSTHADDLRYHARKEIISELKDDPEMLRTVNDIYIYKNQFTVTSMSAALLFLDTLSELAWKKAETDLDRPFLTLPKIDDSDTIPEAVPNHKAVKLAMTLDAATERLSLLLKGGIEYETQTYIEPYGKLRSYEGLRHNGRFEQKGRLAVVHEFEDTLLDIFGKLA